MLASLQNFLIRTRWLLGLIMVALTVWLGYNALVARECRRGSTLPPPYPGMANVRCELAAGTTRLVHFTTPDNPFTIWATYDRLLAPEGWHVSGYPVQDRPDTWYLSAPRGWCVDDFNKAWAIYLHMTPIEAGTMVDVTHELEDLPPFEADYLPYEVGSC